MKSTPLMRLNYTCRLNTFHTDSEASPQTDKSVTRKVFDKAIKKFVGLSFFVTRGILCLGKNPKPTRSLPAVEMTGE
uniref:Uncharacterized protein n=1 Tax=Candidatus Kentrum sp. TUN TaxID=2126343 RepID=A0A450ZLD8_9GAMM|nr:MAG: hypothetical protein BECKTUN1418D_GA0071000_101223 [Candidatus Kentron sp. TUN]VFK53432.1 MAG: hypothetical protein BECKTUN1418F_GA0071002_10214 [Candidatus Kentron sp. TUN]VFK54635.1 MAG: hypothetical protein BECKTUN1418E_GA0071001_10224 [Candidatus Kentron sp. TUN]